MAVINKSTMRYRGVNYPMQDALLLKEDERLQ